MIIFKIDYNHSDDVKTYVDEFWSNTFVRTYRVEKKYTGGDIIQFINNNPNYVVKFNFGGLKGGMKI